LIEKINFKDFKIFETYDFNITTIKNIILTFFKIPFIFFTILKAMRQADHIHLRCPGNMGLLGAVAQIFFPKKKKTAKYAGNWDPKAKQPLSYKLQKWILSNTFLTRNMQVLVYGKWPKQSKNIKPFFTATYSDTEKIDIQPRAIAKDTLIKFLFAGTLSKGKQPLYAVQIVEELFKKGFKVNLELFGNGNERVVIQSYIKNNNLESFIFLRGNQTADFIKQKYQESHFLVLPSKSEGWPKVVAEAMFWGCLPIATPVSCVVNMLDNENRGILLNEILIEDCEKIELLLHNETLYQEKVLQAVTWSQNYTTDYFEEEIKKLL
jgi:glycosyltransferase involved in cell wall biosynthesis